MAGATSMCIREPVLEFAIHQGRGGGREKRGAGGGEKKRKGGERGGGRVEFGGQWGTWRNHKEEMRNRVNIIIFHCLHIWNSQSNKKEF